MHLIPTLKGTYIPTHTCLEQPEEAAAEGLIDSVEDRLYDHPHVGKRIRALYDAGWAEGTVTWLNTIIGLRVEYEDDSEDYIKESEINGVDIFFPL